VGIRVGECKYVLSINKSNCMKIYFNRLHILSTPLPMPESKANGWRENSATILLWKDTDNPDSRIAEDLSTSR